jgi:hypothetical protein
MSNDKNFLNVTCDYDFDNIIIVKIIKFTVM